MDKKYFEDRIAEIKRSIENHVLQHNQLIGHLAECEWHLSQILEKEKAEAEQIPDGNIPAPGGLEAVLD